MQAAEKRAEAQKRFDKCSAAYGELADELKSLGSRLDIGLTYGDYGTAVGDVKVAYDDANEDESAEFDCISTVGLPLEKALNEHIKASSTWDDCFDSFDCDNDSIQPKLQRRWTRATIQVERADEALDGMKPDAG